MMGINASSNLDQDGPIFIGLLPMIEYLFEEVNVATTIFMDEGHEGYPFPLPGNG